MSEVAARLQISNAEIEKINKNYNVNFLSSRLVSTSASVIRILPWMKMMMMKWREQASKKPVWMCVYVWKKGN